MIYAYSQMRGFESALRLNARAEGDGVYSLATPRPLCFSVGLWRPAIYVSTALREQLSAAELRAVMAHEAAHVRRRDTLTAAALTLFYTCLSLPGGRLLLRDWRQAVERKCDEEAAREVGSAVDVAAALVRVARLSKQSAVGLPLSVCFAGWGDDVEGRVQALLEPIESGRSSAWRVRALAVLSLAVVLMAGQWLPHAVEVFAHH
jgi:Zn-dependent protease with chaperone function